MDPTARPWGLSAAPGPLQLKAVWGTKPTKKTQVVHTVAGHRTETSVEQTTIGKTKKAQKREQTVSTL